MNINDFQGTIPDGRLNPPDDKDWGRDMEQDESCDNCRFKNMSMSVTPCYFCPYGDPPFKYYEPIPSPEGEPDDEKA
jgi:hypothetical protein